VPLFGEELGPHLTQSAEAYLLTKWHPGPSNRLATIRQRYRQTDRADKTEQTTVRLHRANRFTNGRPKIIVVLFSFNLGFIFKMF